MKKLIVISLLLLPLLGISPLRALAQLGSDNFIPADPNVQYVYANKTGGIANAIASASTGDLTKLGIGTFTPVTTDIAGGTFYIEGESRKASIISGTDTLFDVAADGDLYLINLTLSTTALVGDMFGTVSGAKIHLIDCDVNFRFIDFEDSVWADNCTFTSFTTDSFRVTDWFDFQDCIIKDAGLTFGTTFGDTAIGELRDCEVYATDGGALHFPNSYGKSTVKIMGGYYETTKATGYAVGISGFCELDIINAAFYGGATGAGSATLYAHGADSQDTTDTPDITIANCTFFNPSRHTGAYNVTIWTADTIEFTGNSGNALVELDSCEFADPTNLGAPIVYWSSNWFGDVDLNFGAANIAANLRAPKTAAQNVTTSGTQYISDCSVVANQADALTVTKGSAGTKYRILYDGQSIIANPVLLSGANGKINADWTGSAVSIIYESADKSVVKADTLFWDGGQQPAE